jgi:drug/metabolite transporter (DMT)-like permease
MTENRKAMFAALASSLGFVTNDTLVKLAAAELPAGQIIVWRGAMATTLLFILAAATGSLRSWRTLADTAMVLRIAAAVASTILIVVSLAALPLPIVNAVLQLTPLSVTAGAALYFREHVGWMRWAAALTGFIGVLMIIRPGGSSLGPLTWLPLVALIFTTLRDLSTRAIPRDVPTLFAAAATSAAITAAGLVFWPFETWVATPSMASIAYLAAAALALCVGYSAIVMAMRTGEVAVIAPFRYISIPISLAFGYWIWGDIPDTLAFAGITLILLTGLAATLIEARDSRSLQRRAHG